MSEAVSLRETLQAAMAPEAEVAPVIAAEPIAAAPEAGADSQTAAAEAAPVTGEDAAPVAHDGRDEKGRFAPKEPKAPEAQAAPEAEAKPETAAPVEAGAQDEPTRIPPSLSAAVKAQWKDLPVEVRKDISKLEESVQTAKAEWGRKGERLNRFDELIGPRREKWQLSGLDEFSGIQTLLAAQDVLERNPVEGISWLARSYGVNLQQLAGQTTQLQPGAEGQPAPTAAPDLQAALTPYLEQVRTLEQQLQAITQGNEAAKLADARAEVEAFKSKPENLYFENVKEDVSRRLESGAAATLADAYEQAIWASAEIRPLLIKAQTAAPAPKTAEAAQREKAANARQAAGSVTGAPSPGAIAPRAGSKGNLREDLLASFQEHGASV